jgi:hypothetical protein
MSRRSLRTIGTLGIIALSSAMMILSSPAAESQGGVSEVACRGRVVKELEIVHDEFRAHIFGARRDRAGGVTVITGGSAIAPITGILETRGRLSSELIEPILDSYRVLRCRSTAVCQTMQQSFVRAGPVKLEPLGCAAATVPRFGECRLAGSDSSLQQTQQTLTDACATLVERSLNAERAVLIAAMSYDSGYRAALQIGGMMDWMRQNLSSAVLQPIRDMLSLLGKLHEIPCFIGQCDTPDTSRIIP